MVPLPPPLLSYDVKSAGKHGPVRYIRECSLTLLRRALATSSYLVKHEPSKTQSSARPTDACSHYFLDPLSWMRPELEQGKLDGRLECPKCKTNVGKYAWQGMQCSCGDWVLPAISLARGKIDEVLSRSAGSANVGLRMPPNQQGRKPGTSHENL